MSPPRPTTSPLGGATPAVQGHDAAPLALCPGAAAVPAPPVAGTARPLTVSEHHGEGARTSPSGPIPAGAGPGGETSAAGTECKEDAAAPAAATGLRGKAFLRAVRDEKARQAKAQRNQRGRRYERRGGFRPGMARRPPETGGAS